MVNQQGSSEEENPQRLSSLRGVGASAPKWCAPIK